MNEPSNTPERKIIGYTCEVCHGKNVRETDNEILHACEGVLIPVFVDEYKNAPESKEPEAIYAKTNEGDAYFTSPQSNEDIPMCHKCLENLQNGSIVYKDGHCPKHTPTDPTTNN